MKVRDFIKEHIECNLSMMTPCGFIDLTAEMSRRFMEGGTISTHPGCSECHMDVNADVILDQTVISQKQEGNTFFLLTEW